MAHRTRSRMLRTRIAWLILVSAGGIQTAAKNAVQEQGEFKIFVDGKEIGTERYFLAVAGDSASSTSILDVKNPANSGKKEHMESKLDMDGQFRPVNYRLTKDVDGKKATIVGFFSPNQAMFEYSSGTAPIKKGLLVGNDYTILDTNLFHHFVFLVRLFKFDAKEKIQRFEVVIPQAIDSGILKVSEVDRETLVVKGKKTETRRLQIDSGALVIHLWVDKQRVLQRISVPGSSIEVLRDS